VITRITDADVLRRALQIAHDTTATADEAIARAKHEAEIMAEALDPYRLRRRIRVRRRARPPRDVRDDDRWMPRDSARWAG
jgi:hypothetical protein